MLRFFSLVDNWRVTNEDISTLELGDVKRMLWVILLDCCAGGEFTTRLDFFVNGGCDVVRERGEDGSHG